MNCEQALDLIQRNLDGDLSDWETALLQKHLAICPKCEKRSQQLEQLSQRLSRWPQVTPPIAIVDRMLSQEAKVSGPIRYRYKRLFQWLGGGVAALLIGGFFWKMSIGLPEEGERLVKTQQMESGGVPISILGEEESPRSFWSPDQQYRAEVEEHQVVIYTREGEIRFRSSPWESGGEAQLKWINDRKLTLHIEWENRQEVWQIDISKEQPIEVKVEDGS